MARAVFPYELDDPDFSWLLSKFREDHPQFILVDSPALPLILIDRGPEGFVQDGYPMLPAPEVPAQEVSGEDEDEQGAV